MKKIHSFYLAGFVSLLLAGHTVFGQGPLTSPGAPASTMKTLDQVQPRIAITSLPIIITQGGSYYLTKSFAQTFSTDAITIRTNNVTLDFCGFTLQQTGGGSTIAGIRIDSPSAVIPVTNAVIQNGSITGFAASAINCLGIRNCIFQDLAITECFAGISAQPLGSAAMVGNVARRCRVCDSTGGSGIAFSSGTGSVQNVFDHCIALNNASAGFAMAGSGNFIMNCLASGNANNYVIASGNRMGLIASPGTNVNNISGASGGVGTGSSDPFENISY